MRVVIKSAYLGRKKVCVSKQFHLWLIISLVPLDFDGLPSMHTHTHSDRFFAYCACYAYLTYLPMKDVVCDCAEILSGLSKGTTSHIHRHRHRLTKLYEENDEALH